MAWFSELKLALPEYYTNAYPLDVVGYLQGAGSPNIWKQMAATGRHQMLILGNAPPDNEDWTAAGVAQRGQVQTLRIGNLAGWIVLYGGFIRRPWGQLFEMSNDAKNLGFPGALQSWKANKPKRR